MSDSINSTNNDYFSISDLPKLSTAVENKEDEESVAFKSSIETYLEEAQTKVDFLKKATIHEVYIQYQSHLKLLPNSTKPATTTEILSKICCGSYCNFKFTAEFVMKAHQLIPTTCSDNDSIYNAVNQFQFKLVEICIVDGNFLPKANGISICEEFFRRLYIIPKERFDNFINLIMQKIKQALPHGNTGGGFERTKSTVNFVKLINAIDTVAEPHPSGTGFLMPSGMTKTDCMTHASLNEKSKANATKAFKKMDKTIHIHKANSFTKCHTCVQLKIAKANPRLPASKRAEARKHLKNHRKNILNDRRDYYIRKFVSLEEGNLLLSLAHDGMSKHKTKFPHLLNDATKRLVDPLRMMCSLNMAVVHKKSADTDHQLHCYWNIDQISGARSNAVISQLFFTISHCSVIPSNIAIQLDNCSANKCYTLFGAFGSLLLWVPKLTKVRFSAKLLSARNTREKKKSARLFLF